MALLETDILNGVKDGTPVIYTLSDASGVRYVGKSTVGVMHKRYLAHMSDLSKRTKKVNWIKKLLSKGLTPEMEVIDVCFDGMWEFWEMYWISQMRGWGFDILNMTDGGTGQSLGYVASSETRLKLSKSLKDAYSSGRKRVPFKDVPTWNKGIRYYMDKKSSKLLSKDIPQLILMYINTDMSQRDIADYFGISRRRVADILRKENIKKNRVGLSEKQKAVLVDRLVKRSNAKKERYDTVIEMSCNGLSPDDIAKSLGIRIQLVKVYLRENKNK